MAPDHLVYGFDPGGKRENNNVSLDHWAYWNQRQVSCFVSLDTHSWKNCTSPSLPTACRCSSFTFAKWMEVPVQGSTCFFSVLGLILRGGSFTCSRDEPFSKILVLDVLVLVLLVLVEVTVVELVPLKMMEPNDMTIIMFIAYICLSYVYIVYIPCTCWMYQTNLEQFDVTNTLSSRGFLYIVPKWPFPAAKQSIRSNNNFSTSPGHWCWWWRYWWHYWWWWRCGSDWWWFPSPWRTWRWCGSPWRRSKWWRWDWWRWWWKCWKLRWYDSPEMMRKVLYVEFAF